MQRRLILAAAAAALPLARAHATWMPDRPIRIIVPLAPGVTADTIARLGQSVIVENRPGGTNTIAAAAVARAPADGLTLLYAPPPVQILNPLMMRSLPYDAFADFAPVVALMRAPNLLVVRRDFPAGSVAELIALAKRQPGVITFASSGIGSSAHLAASLFAQMAGIDITHLPYRGTGPALTDLMAGTVSMALDTLSILLPPSQAGRLRALGVTTPQRSRLVPEIPALAETLPGFDAAPFNYIVATGGTPAPAIATLNLAIVGILNDPAYRARMEALGEEATPSSPEELAATIAAESARWKRVIDAAGIRVE